MVNFIANELKKFKIDKMRNGELIVRLNQNSYLQITVPRADSIEICPVVNDEERNPIYAKSMNDILKTIEANK